jgi:hypothetical protein
MVCRGVAATDVWGRLFHYAIVAQHETKSLGISVRSLLVQQACCFRSPPRSGNTGDQGVRLLPCPRNEGTFPSIADQTQARALSP